MKLSIRLFLIVSVFHSINIFSQSENNGVFKDNKNAFYEELKKESAEFFKKEKSPDIKFKVDFSALELPESIEEFEYQWHNAPTSQGIAGTCWSFSTTSYFESEIYRIHQKKVKLSEIYTAYWEYVEKARRFVRERGDSFLGEGSEANAVRRIWDLYGIVPESVYSGKLPGQKVHDHSRLFKELKSYLNNVKINNAWNEDNVIETVRTILDDHLGEPPASFEFEGKVYTPKEFLKDYLQLNLDNYVDIISLKQYPLNEYVEYTVPDNWWQNSDYYNVTLSTFMNIINKAVKNGHTVVIGGDVSEPGIDGDAEAAIIPDFDIPSGYINDDARQLRFSNETTTDDHGIHIIGYKEGNGKIWYLIKDSGSRAFLGPNKGYYFYHEDYVKLKIVDFMIHKDLVRDLIK